MRTAREGGNNKQHQTHTKTLETNTIRIKSWRDSLSLIPRTPAIVAIAAGFFVLFALPGLVGNARSQPESPEVNQQQPIDTSLDPEAASSKMHEDLGTNSQADQVKEESMDSSSSSVKINMSIKSSQSSDPANNSLDDRQSVVEINGQTIEPNKNGRIYEVHKDENSTTRIRGSIKDSGNSSISISTDSEVNTEGD